MKEERIPTLRLTALCVTPVYVQQQEPAFTCRKVFNMAFKGILSRLHPLLWVATTAAFAVLLGTSQMHGAGVAAAEAGSLTGCVFNRPLIMGWPDLIKGQEEGRLDFKQGGLGTQSTTEYKTWMCIRPHPCALTDIE